MMLLLYNALATTICCRLRDVGIEDGLVVDLDQSCKFASPCLRKVKVVIKWELSVRLPIVVYIRSVVFRIVMNFNFQFVFLAKFDAHRPQTFSRIKCFIFDNNLTLTKLELRLLVCCMVAEK